MKKRIKLSAIFCIVFFAAFSIGIISMLSSGISLSSHSSLTGKIIMTTFLIGFLIACIFSIRSILKDKNSYLEEYEERLAKGHPFRFTVFFLALGMIVFTVFTFRLFISVMDEERRYDEMIGVVQEYQFESFDKTKICTVTMFYPLSFNESQDCPKGIMKEGEIAFAVYDNPNNKDYDKNSDATLLFKKVPSAFFLYRRSLMVKAGITKESKSVETCTRKEFCRKYI